MTASSKGYVCTVLYNVYELTYVPLNPDFLVYSTQERLSALSTTTTPPPPPCDQTNTSPQKIYLVGSSDTLSVNSNNYYVNSQDIEWRIQVPLGSSVSLTWLTFDVEVYDEVWLADPCTGSSYSWSTYTGTSLPPAFTSIGNEMIIRFITDSSVIHAGFSVTYNAI
nr:tumor necrosis factor-inducible gene 6 protein-like [Penaeus vannamei]